MSEAISMFVGVNVGYEGHKFAITDPNKAVQTVARTLQSITNALGDESSYRLFPGLALYNCNRGCPKGGEAIAVVLADGAINAVIATARELRKQLNQSTLFVGISEDGIGQRTRGFYVTLDRSLSEVREVWQLKAAEYNATHDLYVPCGVYENDSGNVTIRSDANPGRFQNVVKWENAAREIIGSVGKELGVALQPHFRNIGFTYLSLTH